jgi:2'-5' RNA ligase
MTTQHADDAGAAPASPSPEPSVRPDEARAPLLVTLELAPPAQELFQSLRNRHFPPGRNVVPAHVSLFHALPGAEREAIVRRLRAVTAPRPAVRVEAPFPLGRGVGFRLHAPALLSLREALARDWAPWLTPQDRQGYRPHVTVQNKVSPEEARTTLQRLQQGFVPFSTEGAALRLWRYLGGPWEALETVALAPSEE